MPDDAQTLVVDASVAAKLWFEEHHSELADRVLKSGSRLVAPDLLLIEVASIAAKRVRRGLSPAGEATNAMVASKSFLDETETSAKFVDRAFELACNHGLSVYDGVYLALAEARRAPLITADNTLVTKARAAGLDHLVRSLVDVA
ncbi:MAG TPA: type II toxin-antitoxin system VapC family toxin [Caulobacteraceae bacterium]|jgi:predicted nucleic acid-binding protein|nr:type II toxin-antitoxin system VapC family toxin [Caulobacteraceae bacterium]